jgi:hypothetical protein
MGFLIGFFYGGMEFISPFGVEAIQEFSVFLALFFGELVVPNAHTAGAE